MNGADAFAQFRHDMFRRLRSVGAPEAGLLDKRMARLDAERLYSRRGWRVAVRRVIVPKAPAARVAAPAESPLWRRWTQAIFSWLTHPLIEFRV